MSIPRRRKLRISLSFVVVGLSVGVLAQEVPTIEPTYTRVYGNSLWVLEASISPNGRWIAFTEGEEGVRTNLWLVPAEGGEPIRLTSGRYQDDFPVWFPGSDRIAFRSDRGLTDGVMTLPVDPLTGQPTGPTRAVTLDACSAWFDVSPDGRWIAYTTMGTGGHAIKVLPATGGTARTIVDPGGRLPAWSADGSSLYYVRDRERDSPRYTLMRVSVDGGRPEPMFSWPGPILAYLAPNAEFVLRQIQQDPDQLPRGRAQPLMWDIATVEGRSLGWLSMPRAMHPEGISSTGDEILAVRQDRDAFLQVLPVDGGPVRQLNEAGVRDDPLGWKPDGSEVFFRTQLGGREVLLLVPVDGGQTSEVRLPRPRIGGFDPVLSGDGQHVLYAIREGEGLSTLRVFSLQDGSSWDLTRRRRYAGESTSGGPVTGAGGTGNRDGEDFLYLEKRENRLELWASPPRGPSRLLWAFGGEQPPTSIGVHGDRIAFAENTETGGSLLVASAGEPTARRILSLDGYLDMVAWSPDGRWIATNLNTNADIVLVEVATSGEIIGEPRYLDVPPDWWWGPQWLPDSRGIVVSGVDANVWLIPLDPSANPVALTQDEPDDIWRDFVLSPDGRHIAYVSEFLRGSSIWRLDLGDALQAGRR